MKLSLKLDRQSNQSLYMQIAEQIKTRISDGRLPARTRLPTIRQLATDLNVTRLTVQNAYAELREKGWIEATVGKGTFVSRSVQNLTTLPSPESEFITPDSAIRDMLQVNQIVGVRSMALAYPDPSLFPSSEFWSHISKLRLTGVSLFEYGPLQGDSELRVEIANLLRELGIKLVPEDMLITSGALQAIPLVAEAIAHPGDAILVEQPTFLGMFNILKAQKLNPVGIPLDNQGPYLALLEEAIKEHKPRFYYTIPNFHNPTGISSSLERRLAILDLALRYDFMIVEDDVYGYLSYDAPPPLSLKALDKSEQVIYLSSFSKVLMPGLHLGYVVAPPPLRTRMLALRRARDLGSPILLQRALAHFLADDGLKRHLRRIVPAYKERRDTLLTALRREMPKTAKWSKPTGGFCCWVNMPRYFSDGELYRIALKKGFAFTPGEAYQVNLEREDSFRLCFGNQSVESINAGVKLLSNLILDQIDSGRYSARQSP